jgi:tRNA uridine 5-carboxymethylaminomethyl modification enzyme
LGVVDDVRWDAFNRKRDAVSRETERLKSTWINPSLLPEADAVPLLGKSIEREYNLADLLRRPAVTYGALMALQGGKFAPPQALDADPLLVEQIREQIEIGIKYHGYIARQAAEVDKLEANESTRLPENFDYTEVRGLGIEVGQKLNQHRPETLGQASRISGVTPAAISLLLVHLKKKGMGRTKSDPSQEAA